MVVTIAEICAKIINKTPMYTRLYFLTVYLVSLPGYSTFRTDGDGMILPIRPTCRQIHLFFYHALYTNMYVELKIRVRDSLCSDCKSLVSFEDHMLSKQNKSDPTICWPKILLPTWISVMPRLVSLSKN